MLFNLYVFSSVPYQSCASYGIYWVDVENLTYKGTNIEGNLEWSL